MKKISYFLFLIIFIIFSCNKDDSNEILNNNLIIKSEKQNRLTEKNVFNLRSEKNDNNKVFLLYKNYMDKYLGNDPSLVFAGIDLTSFNEHYTVEKEKLNSIGFDNYILEMKNIGLISSESYNLLKASYYNPDLLLSDDFINFPTPVYGQDPVYDLLYKISMDLKDRYYMFPRQRLELRGEPCGWTKFIKDVWNGVLVGYKVASIIDEIIPEDEDGNENGEIKILSLSSKATGAIVGGVVGIVIGILDWEACDCGDLYSISVVPASSCDNVGTLRAVGAIGEIDNYMWTIKQNGVINNYTTSVPTLVVQQTNQQFSINAYVIGYCDNGEAGQYAEGTVNLFDGEVGEIILNYNCPEEEDEMFYSCFSTYNETHFKWLSTNHPSGNIQYSYSLSGGEITSSGQTFLKVKWPSEGDYQLVVTATNICSNESTTLEFDIEVYP